jgi:hypothetical protein
LGANFRLRHRCAILLVQNASLDDELAISHNSWLETRAPHDDERR